MTEIITRPQADLLLNLVLGLGFVLAAVGAFVARRRKISVVGGAAFWGGPLVLASLMWRVYNAITDRLGLDSVLNVVVNAVLFVVVGAGCGLVWARFAPHDEAVSDAKDDA